MSEVPLYQCWEIDASASDVRDVVTISRYTPKNRTQILAHLRQTGPDSAPLCSQRTEKGFPAPQIHPFIILVSTQIGPFIFVVRISNCLVQSNWLTGYRYEQTKLRLDPLPHPRSVLHGFDAQPEMPGRCPAHQPMLTSVGSLPVSGGGARGGRHTCYYDSGSIMTMPVSTVAIWVTG